MARKPRGKTYEEQEAGYADRLAKSRTFEQPNPKGGPEIPRSIFTFRWPGDTIEGWLQAGPIHNVRRNASYLLELIGDQAAGAHGEQVEIFGNQQLHTIFQQKELFGYPIRVQYIGLQKVPGVFYKRKVYRVWKIEGVKTVTETELPGSGGAVEPPETDPE